MQLYSQIMSVFSWNCPSMVTLVLSVSPKHRMAESLRLKCKRESFFLTVLFSPLYVTCNPGKILYPCFYSQKYLFTLSSIQESRAGISLYLLKSQTWDLSVGKPFLLVSSKQNHQTLTETVLQRYGGFLLLSREWFSLGSLSSVETQPKKG